jgi:putative endopeptidase
MPLPPLRCAVLVATTAVLAACATTVNSGLDTKGFDPAVRAQDDLFRAVNGRWLQSTEIPADKSDYGAFIQLRDLSDARVRAIVDELATQTHAQGSVAQKVGAFYATFIDTDAIDQAGLAPIAPLLAQIDAINSPSELASWQGRMLGLINPPVALAVRPDFQEPTVNRVITWQGGLGLPDRDYYLKKDDERLAKVRAAYEQYLVLLAAQLKEAQPADAVRRVLALEEQIAQAHWERLANRDPLKIYNPMTLAELTRIAPGFDWAAYFRAAQLGGQERLSVSQPSTATAIAKLFADVPLPEWKLYSTGPAWSCPSRSAMRASPFAAPRSPAPRSKSRAGSRRLPNSTARSAKRWGRSTWPSTFRPRTRRACRNW